MILKRTFWILNILTMVALLLSFMASWISPASIWWLALIGLGFEILFLLNLLFLIYWLVTRSRRFIFPLVFFLIGFWKIFGIFQVSMPSKDEQTLHDKGYFKLMSFKRQALRPLQLVSQQGDPKKYFDFLKTDQPDVVCFQEFYSSDRKDLTFNNEDTMFGLLDCKYAHVEYTLTLHKDDHWGIATYSKYPVVRKSSKHFTARGGNFFIMTDIKIGKDTIRVFNTHLQSVKFNWSDYKFIENLNNDEVEQDEIEGGLNILRHLKRAFVKRAKQVEILHDSMEASPYPIVLCGDLNDTPSSYTYAVLSDDLKDAFRESGNGAGKTYSGPFPSFRIDYIFHDPKITSTGYRTIREKLSDHYPISCMMKVDRK